MSATLAIPLTLLLLAFNAVFVAAEFALISARRTQIEPLAAQGSRSARLTLKAMENVTVVMAAAQLGITMCSLGLGAISEPAVAHLLEPVFAAIHLPHEYVHPVSFVIALSFIVFLHVVYGEMVPKNVALAAPDRAALWLGPIMVAVVAVMRPFVVALNWIANHAVRVMGIEPKDEVASAFTHDQVAGLVEESRREGLLDDDEYELVTGALDFHAGTVGQVLLPIGDLVAIEHGSTPVEIEAACAETGFSRFPVMSPAGDLDGYLHIKDVLETSTKRRREPIADKWIRPLSTVAVESGLDDALRTMQVRGAHMARVVDANGRSMGIILLEDVLEELVGEIRDAERSA